MLEKSSLPVAISIVAILSTAIMGGITAKILPATALWFSAVGFFGVVVAFAWTPVRAFCNGLAASRRLKSIAKHYKTRLVALASTINEFTSAADSRSVGSILNSTPASQLLDAHSVHAYLGHLSSLFSWSKCIQQRAVSGALSGSLLANELQDVIRDYARLSENIAAKLEFGSADRQTTQYVQNAWREISRKTNGMIDELLAINRAINIEDPSSSLGTYLVPVRELNLLTKESS